MNIMDRYNSYYDWLLPVRDKIFSEFGSDIKLSGHELTAVLIGLTQEGKTSFALRLLGATDEEVMQLEKPLRGGRAFGQSATPVPIIYKAQPPNETHNISEKYIRDLESKIKKAREEQPSYLEITLPLKGDIVSTVIDLPGLEAGDEKESHSALENVNKWYYLADLFIYVCSNDNISDFSSYKRHIREIMSRWYINKDSSFIVLTSAYELESVREKIEHLTNPYEVFCYVQKHCEEEMIKQIKQKDLPLLLPVCLKPMDTAESVKQIYKDATQVALQKIKERILDNPIEFKVRAVLAYPQQLDAQVQRFKEQQKEMIAEKEVLQNQLTQYVQRQTKKISELHLAIKDWNKKIRSIENDKIRIDKEVRENGLRNFIKEIEEIDITIPEYKIGEKVERFKRVASQFCKAILSAINVQSDALAVSSEFLGNRTSFTEAYNKLSDEIQNYLKKQLSRVEYGDVIVPGRRKGTKYEETIPKLTNWATTTKHQVIEYVTRWIKEDLKKLIEKKIEQYDKEILNCKLNIKHTKNRIKELISEIRCKKREFNTAIENKQKEIDDLSQNIKLLLDTITEISDYKEWICNEFIKLWNSEIKLINESNLVEGKLNRLAYLWNIRKVYEWAIKYAINREKGGNSG